MSLLISTQAISKSYGAAPLFADISLEVFTEDRLGLIGPNGSGKSTLLKILLGLETPDSGNVIKNSQLPIAYVAQQDEFKPTQTIKEVLFDTAANHLSAAECQYRIWEVTGESVFTDLERQVNTLSGGWRKRLAIIQALLKKPAVLFMDEPTNHLDLTGILWLEALLKRSDFGYVIISHDRAFVENTVNSVIELVKIYPQGYFKAAGNYSDFLQKRGEFIDAQLKKEQTLANKMRQEQAWLQRMPKARTTKAQYRIEQAAQLKADLEKISYSNAQTKTAGIAFSATERKTKVLLKTHDLTISRQGKLLFSELNLNLSPGFCLGLLGDNGSGKSTLMQLLTGALAPEGGFIERADDLRIVTFDQKREQLNQRQTLMQALSPTGDHVLYKDNYIHVAAWARRFLFTPDQLQQPVSHLSGGEQARVLIANLMCQPADILLLDEPTNDLDIPTLEILEESLQDFPGAIVLITHDRFLLEKLSDQILFLDGQGHNAFFADYNQWLSAKRAYEPPKQKSAPDKTSAKNKAKLLSYDEQRELNRLPDKIQKAEAEMQALSEQLQNADISSNSEKLTQLLNQIETLQTKITQFYARWEELDQKNEEQKHNA